MTRNRHALTSYASEFLTSRRNALGLSQNELATRAGATQASVSRFERGLLDPQLSTFLDLTRALELELRLVPREALPAVNALLQSLAHPDSAADRGRPLYALDATDLPEPATPPQIA
jgi:transcriptional regulator with XRE-family HTH domain